MWRMRSGLELGAQIESREKGTQDGRRSAERQSVFGCSFRIDEAL
jgi:hypothetical protein